MITHNKMIMMPKEKARIYVLLTCFNRKELTLQAVRTLLRGTENAKLTFVVTDDHSTDGTVEALKELSADIRIIPGSGNLFWNRGMRVSMRYAVKHKKDWDYVLLINDDVKFFAGVPDMLVSQLRKRDAKVIIGATKDQNGKLSYGGVKKASRFFAKFKLMPPREIPSYADTFNCNCVMLTKEAFLDAGLLDPHYKHSMGDYDYGLTLRRKGYFLLNAETYVGVCDDNCDEGTWRDSKLPRKKRLKIKEGIKGLPFKDWFYFVKKNYCIPAAIYHSITPYIKILIGK
ncbi:MAG: glycosyltransferase [Lachnospiraceae bacterium]|nr:glycosyltransferase [Lachnospiraceae bacterium]